MRKRVIITVAALATAVVAVLAIILATSRIGTSTPEPTVATCTAEIIAHPQESTFGAGCKGLTRDQRMQSTLDAYNQGARG